ncbi:hypothetical protein MP638_006729 [Amoeboaphelidium occidentale]|nr:hypothetical protein MP638_006729 [Amoeboaphelidium occidentale]
MDSLLSLSEGVTTDFDDHLEGVDTPYDRSSRNAYVVLEDNLDSHDKERLPEAITFKLLRVPLLVMIFLIIIVELVLYVFIRQLVFLSERLFIWKGHKLYLKNALKRSRDFSQYRKHALEMDKFMGFDKWKKQDESVYYDYRLIRRLVRLLNSYRMQHSEQSSTVGGNVIVSPVSSQESPLNHSSVSFDAPDLVRVLLDAALKHNIGGVENLAIYNKTFYGTKELVETFTDEVCASLDYLESSQLLNDHDKYKFFKKASRLYGSTALCLSGGATFGYYHLGVVKALREEGILPTVINGTSAGALIAGFVCVRTDEELKSELNAQLYEKFTACSEPIFVRMKRFIQTGAMFDPDIWSQKLEYVLKGDITFQEAFLLTGRILNITVISESEHSPPKCLNYKTSPNVTIKSAVLASSAVPGILPPMRLYQKNEKGQVVPYFEEGVFWRDGSLRIDIPLSNLHQMFQVNYTIVSQVNPHVVLFFFDAKGSSGVPSAHRSGKGWRGGFLLSMLEQYLKLDMKKWLLVLRDMNLLPMIHSQDWSHVYLQKFAGNVTIVPHVTFGNYFNLLTDPDEKRMQDFIDGGERIAWPKIHMLRNRMKIERKIFKNRDKYKEAKRISFVSR